MHGLAKVYFPYLAWLVALSATIGSLYFSEIRNFPACNLCWYQRIFMYPLTLLIPVGIATRDKMLPRYVLPMSIPGGFLALYHTLLQQGIITERVVSCGIGVSCVTKQLDILGFVTIPFLSLTAFVVITGLMFYSLIIARHV